MRQLERNMRTWTGCALVLVLAGCAPVDDKSAGDAGVGADAGARADAGADAGSELHGVFVLTMTTVDPPTRPSVNSDGTGHEVTWEDGKVTYRPFHASGSGGSMEMEFAWTRPPASIAPGTTWPMSASARVVSNVNPLAWDGATDIRGPGGSLLPLASNGGSLVRVTQADPAGTEVSRAAVGVCPEGTEGFTVHVSAPTGNKDHSVDYWYQYAWRP